MENTPEFLAGDLGELGQVAEFNNHYTSSHPPSQYGSPTISTYSSYPDPSQLNAYLRTPDVTPSSPYSSSTTRITRSGRPISSNSRDPLGPQPTGVQKSSPSKPRPKPKKRKKVERTCPPTVERPLSTLLEHMDPKKDVDIDQYVNRAVEVRRQEVADTKEHRVKRPMNAFMLYRKGWQNRIKEMQSNENHQGVSKVAGDSWALEPDEVRNQYNTWSEIERDMHARAFPDYKFKPSKSAKSRVKPESFSDGDETDLEDNWSNIPTGGKHMYAATDEADSEYRPPRRVSGRVYAYQHTAPPSRAVSHSPYQPSPYQHHSPPPVHHNMSHYQYSNPHKPLPNPYTSADSGHYHAQHVGVQQHHHQIPHSHGGYTLLPQPFQTENVFYHRTETPSQHYVSHSPQQHRGPYAATDQYPGFPYSESPYSTGPQCPTPPPGHHQLHQAVPFLEDPSHFAPPPSAVMSINDGADNFETAIGDLGGYEDQFQLAHTGDPAFDINFSLGDGTDVLDPQLLDGAWAQDILPSGALGRQDDILIPAEKNAGGVGTTSEPVLTPTSAIAPIMAPENASNSRA